MEEKCLYEIGIPTQYVARTKKANDQYWTNVALKISAKIDGLNSVLHLERVRQLPLISNDPTIIIGMDADATSIAAVVSSREWPKVSKYRVEMRIQSQKTEMIE